MMTTDTELKISEEPLAERVLRQVRFGKLDESRLLPSGEKRARDVVKNGRAGRCTSATTRTTPTGIATPPSSADETRWKSPAVAVLHGLRVLHAHPETVFAAPPEEGASGVSLEQVDA